MDINRLNKGEDYIYLDFNPQWKTIPFTRQYIQNLLSFYSTDDILIEKINMCVYELLENAIKYSSQPRVRLLLSHLGKNEKLELRVFNYVEKKQIEYIQNMIKEMRRENPLQYYLEKIKRAANKKDGQSGIGLARMQYEANADIKAIVRQNQELEIKITFREQTGEGMTC